MRSIFFMLLLGTSVTTLSQATAFEKSAGKETATYFETIGFYKKLAQQSRAVKMQTRGLTDAGYPLDLVLLSSDNDFNPVSWHKKGKVVILVINGIHPGEPDGIDASMMFVRDILSKKILLPVNVALGVIPVYNIGGALNRNSFSRVNQNGPASYGFRGNAQNLDLNRDFTKCDSRNARSFTEIFHYLNPDILVDTHVSDGADYQPYMTLITTQYDKLGGELGAWVKNVFDPELYKGMKAKDWDMVPYVNVEDADPSKGFSMFYDEPRYSTGYAALFSTIAYMPETHMLKPYAQRVRATYDLLRTFVEKASVHAAPLLQQRKKAIENTIRRKDFPLEWNPDKSRYSLIPFKGYEAGTKISSATGLPVLFYDHQKPFEKEVKYYDSYVPGRIVTRPARYIIPQGWWAVIDLLKLNGVQMLRLKSDSTIEVTVYHIDSLKSSPRAYEKHHRNSQVAVSASKRKVLFLKGDYMISLDQPANRYIVEMLEPAGDDSFFSWNFFDAVLQEKEGYSQYRWNDVAEKYLESHPDLANELKTRKQSDSSFARNGAAQLNFIYKNSPWYEPAHLVYPVYRVENP